MMHAFQQTDDCCSRRLAKAIASGEIDKVAAFWMCRTCGCEWKPRMEGDILYWEPYPVGAVFQ